MTGNMNTPVAVETAPLAAPNSRPEPRLGARRHLQDGRATRRECRRGSARCRASCGRSSRLPASAGRGRAQVATKVPRKLASSVGHSRRMSGISDGPNHACQMLVRSAGMTISAAASPGDMIRLSRPTATVGRPWPSTPLTNPASTNAKPAKAMMKVISGMRESVCPSGRRQCGNGGAFLRPMRSHALQRLAAHQPGLRRRWARRPRA